MRARLIAAAFAVSCAAFACHDWGSARDAYCAREGAFCFDAGASTDAGPDAGPDGGADAGADAGSEDNDAGTDGGMPSEDGGADAAITLVRNIPLWSATGEVLVSTVAAPEDDVLLAGGRVLTATSAKLDKSTVGPTGQYDAFIVQMDRSTGTATSKALVFTSGSDEEITALAARGLDEQYAAGTYIDSITVSAGTLTVEATDGGAFPAAFIARLDQNLKPVWARPIADYVALRLIPRGLAAPAAGPVVIADFDGHTVINGEDYPSVAASHAFVGAFDAAGGYRWTDWFECAPGAGEPAVHLNDIEEAGTNGELLIAGEVVGGCELHDTANTQTTFFGNDTSAAAFYGRFDADGGLIRQQTSQASAPGEASRFTSISFHNSQAAFAGEYEGAVGFGGLSATSAMPAAFVLVVNSKDEPQRLLSITSTGQVRSPRVSLQSDGEVLVAGTFTGTLTADTSFVTAVGDEPNVFVLHLNAELQVDEITSFEPGGPETERLTSAQSPAPFLVLSGWHTQPFQVLGTPVSGSSSGELGSYLLELR